MKKRITVINKVFDILVADGLEKSPTQLAKATRSSESTVRGAISRIRKMGYAIYANVQKDRRGNEKVLYRCGEPTRYMESTGSTMVRQ